MSRINVNQSEKTSVIHESSYHHAEAAEYPCVVLKTASPVKID
jgi:hypothetical protein